MTFPLIEASLVFFLLSHIYFFYFAWSDFPPMSVAGSVGNKVSSKALKDNKEQVRVHGINPYQSSVAVHTKTSPLFWSRNQMMVFIWNATLGWNRLKMKFGKQIRSRLFSILHFQHFVNYSSSSFRKSNVLIYAGMKWWFDRQPLFTTSFNICQTTC